MDFDFAACADRIRALHNVSCVFLSNVHHGDPDLRGMSRDDALDQIGMVQSIRDEMAADFCAAYRALDPADPRRDDFQCDFWWWADLVD